MRLAQQRHRVQLRKSGEPTVNHLREVAELAVAMWAEHRGRGAPQDDVLDEELYACGYLHDSLEDTETDYEDVEKEAGRRVAEWVRALSMDKRLRVDERRARYERQLAAAALPARIVKVADLLSNLRGLRGSEGAAWIGNYVNVVERQLAIVGVGLDHMPSVQEARRHINAWRQWVAMRG